MIAECVRRPPGDTAYLEHTYQEPVVVVVVVVVAVVVILIIVIIVVVIAVVILLTLSLLIIITKYYTVCHLAIWSTYSNRTIPISTRVSASFFCIGLLFLATFFSTPVQSCSGF